MSTPGRNRHPGRLPRLPREYYQGDAFVHWSRTTHDRATGWLTERFHARFRELMLHAAAREGLFCPVYCLMPDHLHLVWMGLRRDSDQWHGMAFLRTYLEPTLVDDEVRSRGLRCCRRRREESLGRSPPEALLTSCPVPAFYTLTSYFCISPTP